RARRPRPARAWDGGVSGIRHPRVRADARAEAAGHPTGARRGDANPAGAIKRHETTKGAGARPCPFFFAVPSNQLAYPALHATDAAVLPRPWVSRLSRWFYEGYH